MPSAMAHLRIATFNTWNCRGAFDRRLALMSVGLKALSADIILAQEVFSELPNGQDVARAFADALEMNVAHAPARKKLRSLNGAPTLSCSGLAVLTRGAVRDHHIVRLPEDPRDGERLGQVVSTTIDKQDVLVANVHLSHLAGEDGLRQRQLDTLMGRMAQACEHDVMVLGGDMNMTAEQPALAALHTKRGFLCVGHDGRVTTTLNPVGGDAVEMGVIDHVFVKAGGGCRIIARTALDARDDVTGLFPSDHMAVVVDIELN